MHFIKKLAPVAIGALIGWSYWYFIGCTSGHCLLTSRWWTATLYGAIAGASFLIPTKKPTVSDPEQKQTYSQP